MRTLWEAIQDNDDVIDKKVKNEIDKRRVREALDQFFEQLHIDSRKVNGASKPVIVNRGHEWINKKCVTVKYYMDDMWNYIISIHHDDASIYYNKDFEAVDIDNQNFIRAALREGFEKYLKSKHVEFEKTSKEFDSDQIYKVCGLEIQFRVWFRDKHAQKPYDKRPGTKSNKEYRMDFKDLSWAYEISVPEEIWMLD